MNLNKLLQLKKTITATPEELKQIVPMVAKQVIEEKNTPVPEDAITSLVNNIIEAPANNLQIIDAINTVVKKIEGVPTEKKWFQSSIIMNAILIILVSVAPQIDKLISKQPLNTLDYVYLLGIAYGGGSVIVKRVTEKNILNIS